MGNFYGNVVLPESTNPSDEAAVLESVKSILEPHVPGEDECFPFSFYFVVEKEWYSGIGSLEDDFPDAIAGSGLVIVPVKSLLKAEEPYVFITPDSEWNQSGSTYTSIDVGWRRRFHELAEPYKELLSAVVYFKC